MRKWKIRRDDEVVVIAGRSKGKKGKVLEVLRDKERVLVQGVNMVRRHTKPSAQSAGGIIEKEAPVHVSNVALADPKTGKPTRVGFKVEKEGLKVRYAKASSQALDQ